MQSQKETTIDRINRSNNNKNNQSKQRLISSAKAMKFSKSSMLLFAVSVASSAVPAPVRGMPANPQAYFDEAQPDGTPITLHLHGDPHDSWLTDQNDYTVLRDPATGFYVYAKPDRNGGLEPSFEIVPSQLLPNKDSSSEDEDWEEEESFSQEEIFPHKLPPNSNSDSTSSLESGPEQLSDSATSTIGATTAASSTTFRKQKNLRPIRRDCRNKICGEHENHDRYNDQDQDNIRGLRGRNSASNKNKSSSGKTSTYAQRRATGASTGKTSMRNLVLLIRWSDHVDRVLPTREDYQVLMNNKGRDAQLCPTGSVRDVFMQNSNGALEIDSYVTNWITMDNTEKYYSNGDIKTETRIRDAILYALEYVDGETGDNKVDFDFFDEDQDGFADGITFIHSGYAAEHSKADTYGTLYTERVWSHEWSMPVNNSFQSKKGRNVKVINYNISSGLWDTKGSRIARIGVISHEMGHYLGLPDLYDLDSSSRGAGVYDMMSDSWGANMQQFHPPYLSAWAKMILGWVTPIEPTTGTNVIEASAEQNPSHPQVYIIKEGFPEGEFLLIENRQPIGFDILLPQGGLAIWHIDYGEMKRYDMYDVSDRQSQEGHPYQEGWPENGKHYAVALLQADGYYDLEMGTNGGDYGDLFHASDVEELVPCQQKNDCQYPNTDSYQNGNIVRSNVHITDISESDSIMSFHYWVGEVELKPTHSPTSFPTFFPTSFPSAPPTISPTTEKERRGRRKGRICRKNRQCSSGYCKKKRRWLFKKHYKLFGKCTLKN